jgi:outer membrane receptor for ferric coprogen and ferric-rhodotorulic acid
MDPNKIYYFRYLGTSDKNYTHIVIILNENCNYFTSYKYNKFTLGGGVNWQSEINALNRNANKNIQQKGYAVVNAMAKYEVKKDFDVILNVNNLFDEEYFNNISYTSTTTLKLKREVRTVLMKLNKS